MTGVLNRGGESSSARKTRGMSGDRSARGVGELPSATHRVAFMRRGGMRGNRSQRLGCRPRESRSMGGRRNGQRDVLREGVAWGNGLMAIAFGSLGFGLDGRLLLARRGRVYV